MEYNNSVKKKRAKKRVEELKGFYIHFMVYIIVNIMISTVIVVGQMYDGTGFIDAIWNFGVISTWLFWGIGMFFHAAKVFGLNPFFGKDWEERQIQKYLDADKQAAEKYK